MCLSCWRQFQYRIDRSCLYIDNTNAYDLTWSFPCYSGVFYKSNLIIANFDLLVEHLYDILPCICVMQIGGDCRQLEFKSVMDCAEKVLDQIWSSGLITNLTSISKSKRREKQRISGRIFGEREAEWFPEVKIKEVHFEMSNPQAHSNFRGLVSKPEIWRQQVPYSDFYFKSGHLSLYGGLFLLSILLTLVSFVFCEIQLDKSQIVSPHT